ncbi:hypothetical protein [Pseudonocardia nigra]|uniref:hypothetical protein n=1 Tax=Pseudonocardia nigra TaxID=1921578 RepID=UPI0027E2DAF3|nr:hypothetical protein [Pseudonocardia nigra]
MFGPHAAPEPLTRLGDDDAQAGTRQLPSGDQARDTGPHDNNISLDDIGLDAAHAGFHGHLLRQLTHTGCCRKRPTPTGVHMLDAAFVSWADGAARVARCQEVHQADVRPGTELLRSWPPAWELLINLDGRRPVESRQRSRY